LLRPPCAPATGCAPPCADAGPIVSIECTDELVFSTSFDGTCRLWEWGGKAVCTLEAHRGHASGLAVLPTEQKLLTGGDDGLIKLFDYATETCLCKCEHGGGEGPNSEYLGPAAVWSVRALGHVVITGSTNGSLRMWDMRAMDRPVHASNAHFDAVAGLQMDESKALSASFDSSVKIWDLRKALTPRAVMYAPPNTRCTRISYDDTRVLTGSLNGTVVSFDLL